MAVAPLDEMRMGMPVRVAAIEVAPPYGVGQPESDEQPCGDIASNGLGVLQVFDRDPRRDTHEPQYDRPPCALRHKARWRARS